jgi:mannose/fructose/N-acetylgalactosamine-specific phosphotransferase system component IIB
MVKSQKRQPLVPRKVINVKGRIHYNESNQSWNTIKLKSEFLNEFQQLREKRSKFSYEMILGKTKEEMVKTIKKIVKDKTLTPVLMFLYKDK